MNRKYLVVTRAGNIHHVPGWVLSGILHTVQKNIDVDLRSSSLERPVGKTGPLLASGNLALGVFPVNSELIRVVHSA